MTTDSAAERFHQRHLADARKAFAHHVITQRSDGRWLPQKRYDDGKPDWTMAAEIISLAGGALYVGGDIDHVVFSWYSDTRAHEDKVRWMGRHKDLRYYVCQKARIGMAGCRAYVETYVEEVAREQVQEWLDDGAAEAQAYADVDVVGKLCDVLADDYVPWEDQRELVEHLTGVLGYDFMYERWDVGEVLAPRVYYAHAALRRLCDLLDAEQEAKAAC